MLFATKKTIIEALTEFVGGNNDTDALVLKLKKEKAELKEELETLRYKKDLEEKQIKHLVKMKMEKQDIEHERKGVALEKELQGKTMKLQTQYHTTQVDDLNKKAEEFGELYKEILKRLPNITATLSKEIK